ncbi:MAG TPA: hypothetical protein VFW03_20920 [Gemmatimonadaceae bacterium]|nr:hypothetical protein [Gemmatimonadaceae bacterium]
MVIHRGEEGVELGDGRDEPSKGGSPDPVGAAAGFVFLEITRILDPNYELVLDWRRADQTVGGHVLHFINTEHRAALRRRRNEYLRGVVLRAAFPLYSSRFRFGTYQSIWPLTVDGLEPTDVHWIARAILPGFEAS